MVNESKKHNPYFWEKWKISGAEGTINDSIRRSYLERERERDRILNALSNEDSCFREMGDELPEVFVVGNPQTEQGYKKFIQKDLPDFEGAAEIRRSDCGWRFQAVYKTPGSDGVPRMIAYSRYSIYFEDALGELNVQLLNLLKDPQVWYTDRLPKKKVR